MIGPPPLNLTYLFFSAVHPSEPGFDQEDTDSRGCSIMENEQGQDYWFALIVFFFLYYHALHRTRSVTLLHQCVCMKVNGCILSFPFRAVHAPPGGHNCSATETRRASDPKMSQQNPGRHPRYKTHLQPHH